MQTISFLKGRNRQTLKQKNIRVKQLT